MEIRNPVLTKTIGLIGGMSWESSIPYYRLINEGVRERLGGLHSARLVLYSVDFHEIERLQQSGDWAQAGVILVDAAKALEAAGAEFLVLCTNTMHKLAGALEAAVSIPLLHIADATATEIRAAGLTRIGLLGTRYTMEQDFYVGRLQAQALEVLVPEPDEREIVHRVIYEELCQGRIDTDSRAQFRAIIASLIRRPVQMMGFIYDKQIPLSLQGMAMHFFIGGNKIQAANNKLICFKGIVVI